MSFIKYMLDLRKKIIECCKNGDYVLINEETESILQGEITIDLSLYFNGLEFNEDVISEKRKREMKKEYAFLKKRFSNLLVNKIPARALQFRESPRHPTPIISLPCFSGIVSLLQLLFAIPPIRKLYVHARWIDGVPEITDNSEFIEQQAVYLHEMIGAIFDQMLVFCSDRPEKALPVEELKKRYEEMFMYAIEKIALAETSSDLLIYNLFNSFSNPSVTKHPAFERRFKETFVVEYIDHNDNVFSDFCIHLYIDRFVPYVFYFRDVFY